MNNDNHFADVSKKGDTIYRQDAIDAQEAYMADHPLDGYEDELALINILRNLPSAQPEPTERIYKRGYADGYHKAEKDYFERTQKYRDDAFIAGIETEKEIVRKWLLAYHRMSFALKGRYLPHEVISWLVNDISKKLLDEGTQE